MLDSKQKKINSFNPDEVGKHNGNLYGLPFSAEESEIIIIPVPWEATVSYRGGTAAAPAAILSASPQLDLYDSSIINAWQLGIHMLPIAAEWVKKNTLARKYSRSYIDFLEHGGEPNSDTFRHFVEIINNSCYELKEYVFTTATYWIAKQKIVGVLGGDHSTPLGLLQALTNVYADFGILQIDAHADLRDAYEGFDLSHASIMFNALKYPQISKLVQVGIRDYCFSEAKLIQQSAGRIQIFEDKNIKRRKFEGQSLKSIYQSIIDLLPESVYISYDVDGLRPSLCPNTGTPVPGGFEYEEVVFLIDLLVESGRKIIGFDLCEVVPGKDGNEWDAIVGARILYHLANAAGLSQGKLAIT